MNIKYLEIYDPHLGLTHTFSNPHLFDMLDYTAILSILSVIATAIFAAHLTFKSRCWGCEITVATAEGHVDVDVDLGSEIIEADIDIKTGKIDFEIKEKDEKQEVIKTEKTTE